MGNSLKKVPRVVIIKTQVTISSGRSWFKLLHLSIYIYLSSIFLYCTTIKMFHTKIEESQQLDSGLGDSFGPDCENPVSEVGNSLTRLDVSQEQEDQFIKLMRQAFTPDEDNDT